jgi:eukaryotic-like serine/threonine-protein kinase
MVGSRIAHYEITAKLGQGGMGEVYRATDSKLDREVAVKVLPESLAQDAERLARFEREAKTLATLNHPNIAGIYGLEQSGESHALILELVEGEDLSVRLQRAALPIDEVIEVGKQIAEALEAAHANGIIHRDLKPANIKVTSEGLVKVLDFGLAKAMGKESDSDGNVTQDESPTLTADYTLPGVVLGTAGYMSPEQAKGRTIDRRSDVWSFGVVLFECLTGQRLFRGENVSDSIGAVLHKDPDWSALPEGTPPALQLLLHKCLAKDRKRRLHDIADARVDLEQTLANPTSSFGGPSSKVSPSSKRGNVWGGIRTVAVAMMCLALGAIWVKLSESEPPKKTRRFKVQLSTDVQLYLDRGCAVKIAPDGSAIAFMGATRSDAREGRDLYLRPLDQLEADYVDSSWGVHAFDFSPDGRRFIRRGYGHLNRFLTNGGKPVSIGLFDITRDSYGLDWAEDGAVIVGGEGTGVRRIQIETGAVDFLSSPRGEGESHLNPQLLSGGKAILYQVHKQANAPADIVVQTLPGGQPRVIARDGHDPRYLSSGHIVFVRQGSLMALPFDLNSLQVKGSLTHILDGIASRMNIAHYDIAADGTLVYVPGAEAPVLEVPAQLEWIDREGKRERVPLPDDKYGLFQLSPDGKRLAYAVNDTEDRSDIWIYKFGEYAPLRLNLEPIHEWSPTWSPTGESLALVASDTDDYRGRLYWANPDQPRSLQLLSEESNIRSVKWSPLGDYLVASRNRSEGRSRFELQAFSIQGSDENGWMTGEAIDLPVDAQYAGSDISVSPDGHWFAYISREADEMDVYVQRFPNGGGMKRIAGFNGRFDNPIWSPNGTELLFSARIEGQAAQIYSVKYQIVGNQFVPERPVPWEGGTFLDPGWNDRFDISPDGQRVLVCTQSESFVRPIHDHVVLVENFFEVLREKAPTD